MNYNYLVLSLLIIGLISSSCKDFVDLDPPTTVSQDQYFNNPNDFESAVNGLYSSLRTYYNSFYLYAELPSDNSRANGFNFASADMDQMSWYPSYGRIENLWSRSYSTIARANIINGRIENFTDIDEDLKEQYIAESKFVRALMYFNLVQFFGDVPLILKEIENEEEAYSYLRAPVDEVNEQIENDLQEAITSLPEEYSSENTGKVTKWAAMALLSKVYVTNKQYEEAIPLLEEIIDSNSFELLPNYGDIFSVDNENNEEIIFAIQYLGGSGHGEGSPFSLSFAPRNSDISSGGIPGASNEGTLDLWNAFENGDSRKEYSIGYFSDTDVYYTRKFLDQPTSGNEGENDWIVFRYAEVLLLYAEALNESGLTEEAHDFVNEIRIRAELLPFENLNQDELRSEILRERRVELCFEGKRWFDLVRTETMVSTMSEYQENYIGSDQFAVDFIIDENRRIFPIPFSEISLNPELTQNPGY